MCERQWCVKILARYEPVYMHTLTMKSHYEAKINNMACLLPLIAIGSIIGNIKSSKAFTHRRPTVKN